MFSLSMKSPLSLQVSVFIEHPVLRRRVGQMLSDMGCTVRFFRFADEWREHAGSHPSDLFVLGSGAKSCLQYANELRRAHINTPILIAAETLEYADIVAAMRLRVADLFDGQVDSGAWIERFSVLFPGTRFPNASELAVPEPTPVEGPESAKASASLRELERLKKEIMERDAQLQHTRTIQTALLEKENALSARESECVELEESLAEQEASLLNKASTLEAEKRRLKVDAKEWEARKADWLVEQVRLETLAKELSTQQKTLQGQARALQSSKVQLEAEKEAFYEEVQTEQARLESDRRKLQAQQEATREALARLRAEQEEAEELVVTVRGTESRLQELEKMRQALTEETRQLVKTKEGYEMEAASTRVQLEQEIAALEARRTSVQSELKILQVEKDEAESILREAENAVRTISSRSAKAASAHKDGQLAESQDASPRRKPTSSREQKAGTLPVARPATASL